jgi:hypothetical protein
LYSGAVEDEDDDKASDVTTAPGDLMFGMMGQGNTWTADDISCF